MHSPESASFPEGGGTPADEARQVIVAVIGWYNTQLMAARRSGDQQRHAELATKLQACYEDRDRLDKAGPEEVARLAAVYTEQLESLASE